MDNKNLAQKQQKIIADLKVKYCRLKSQLKSSVVEYCENPLDEKISFLHYQALIEAQTLYQDLVEAQNLYHQLQNISADQMPCLYFIVGDFGYNYRDPVTVYWNLDRSTWTLEYRDATRYPSKSAAEIDGLKEAKSWHGIENKNGSLVKNIRIITIVL